MEEVAAVVRGFVFPRNPQSEQHSVGAKLESLRSNDQAQYVREQALGL